MSSSKRSLELQEDSAFERRQWRVQRAGWVVITLTLVAALAGLFGKGPLSHATASNGDLRVQYERFLHADAPASLTVSVENLSGDLARLAIDRSLLEALDVQRMQPRPVRSQSAGDVVVFEFPLRDTRALRVLIDANPQSSAVVSGSFAVLAPERPSTVRIRQLIYP